MSIVAIMFGILFALFLLAMLEEESHHLSIGLPEFPPNPRIITSSLHWYDAKYHGELKPGDRLEVNGTVVEVFSGSAA